MCDDNTRWGGGPGGRTLKCSVRQVKVNETARKSWKAWIVKEYRKRIDNVVIGAAITVTLLFLTGLIDGNANVNISGNNKNNDNKCPPRKLQLAFLRRGSTTKANYVDLALMRVLLSR